MTTRELGKIKDAHYVELGLLLGSPLKDWGRVERLFKALQGPCPEAAASLAQFRSALAGSHLGEIEEAYTRAFDVAPQCVPYVSVHLFGEENYKRGELMSALLSAFARVEFDHGVELPDHVSVLLCFTAHIQGEERRELLNLCLREPLTRMTAALKRGQNPYGHLLQAARDLVDQELKDENQS